MNKSLQNFFEWADTFNIPENIIPRNEIDLLSLEELNLSSYNLFSIPKEIKELTTLESLWLGYNYLEKLPEEIGDLISIKKLSLSNNKLTTLPQSIINLKKLQFLILENNPLRLTFEQEQWLDNLKNNGCIVTLNTPAVAVNNSKASKIINLNEKVISFLNEIHYQELIKKIINDGIETQMDYLLNICVQHKKNQLIIDLLNKVATNAMVCEVYFDEDDRYNRRKFFYTTLLHYGIKEQNINIVKLLLFNQKDNDIADEKGRKPLSLALRFQDKEIVSLLVKHKFSVNTNDLISNIKDAITNRHLSFLEYIVSELTFTEDELNTYLNLSFYEDYADGYNLFLLLSNTAIDTTKVTEAFIANKPNILKYLFKHNNDFKDIKEYFLPFDEFDCSTGLGGWMNIFLNNFKDDFDCLNTYIQFGIEKRYFSNYKEYSDNSFLLDAAKKSKLCLVEFILKHNNIQKKLNIDLQQEVKLILFEISENNDISSDSKIYLLKLLSTIDNTDIKIDIKYIQQLILLTYNNRPYKEEKNIIKFLLQHLNFNQENFEQILEYKEYDIDFKIKLLYILLKYKNYEINEYLFDTYLTITINYEVSETTLEVYSLLTQNFSLNDKVILTLTHQNLDLNNKFGFILNLIENNELEKLSLSESETQQIIESLLRVEGDEWYGWDFAAIDETLFYILKHTEQTTNLFTDEFLSFINENELVNIESFLTKKTIKNIENLNEQLITAVENNQNNNVIQLLKNGADVNCLIGDTWTNTPVVVKAIKNKNFDLIKILVEYGADINKALESAYDFLTQETKFLPEYEDREKSLEERNEIEKTYGYIIEWLYKIGARLKISTANKMLRKLVESVDNPEMVQILLNFNADYMDYSNTTALYIAIEKGRHKSIKLFLRDKKEVAKFQITSVFDSAIKHNDNTETVKLIYEAYPEIIDLNSLSFEEYGYTYMHTASESNQPHMIDFLYNNKADLDSLYIKQDWNTKELFTTIYTPLLGAASSGSYYCVKKLLDYGANTNNINLAMQNAVENNKLFTVKLLLEYGVDANYIDNDGNSFLHMASYEGSYEVLKYLLEIGCNHINTKNKEGNTPLLSAIKLWTREEIVLLLLNKRADVNSVNNEKKTIFILLLERFLRNGEIDINLIEDIIKTYKFDKKINDCQNIFKKLIKDLQETLEYTQRTNEDDLSSIRAIQKRKRIIDFFIDKKLINVDDIDKEDKEYIVKL